MESECLRRESGLVEPVSTNVGLGLLDETCFHIAFASSHGCSRRTFEAFYTDATGSDLWVSVLFSYASRFFLSSSAIKVSSSL
jgi:hypothetical protein